MKRPPSKDQLRDEIDRQVREYLGEGGEIEQVERGATGLDRCDFRQPQPSVTQPRQERTPIPEVVAAIEARRRSGSSRRKTSTRRAKAPRRKAIYDDFGEPVRWVWVDE